MASLTQDAIRASLFTYWRDEFPLAVPTSYSGLAVETESAAEWIELWIESWLRRPQRATGVQLIDVVVTAHVFVKPGLDESRADELAEAVRGTVSQRRVGIFDYEASGQPLVGWATLFEAEGRELTRSHRERGEHGLRHVVLTTAGMVQPV